MKVLLAKDAGYCFGVRDAVNLAYETAEKEGEVYMLGHIVHNENVVTELEKTGTKISKFFLAGETATIIPWPGMSVLAFSPCVRQSLHW